MSPAPLDGLLVADFTRVLAGPLCAQTLGDLGADVVKVERPGSGDDTRSWGPPFAEQGASYYLGLNRNKRSLLLDLHDDADAGLARELCARADVVLESFRPGTMERFGLGFEDVHELNPRAVYGSVSGFGSGAAGRELPGYDLLLQAMGGLMSVTGEAGEEGRPLKVGAALVDMISGLYLTNAVLAALHERERSGTGQRVEVSLMDGVLAALLNQGSGYLTAGPFRAGWATATRRSPRTRRSPPATASSRSRSATTRCSPGSARRSGGPSCQPTSGSRRTPRAPATATRSAPRSRARWPATTRRPGRSGSRAAGVPAGPVNDVAQAYELAERLGLEPVDRGRRRADRALADAAGPHAVVARRGPPALGEHDDELRAWLRGGVSFSSARRACASRAARRSRRGRSARSRAAHGAGRRARRRRRHPRPSRPLGAARPTA